MTTVQTDQEKLVALEKKLAGAEEKLKARLKNFRGVPHESASGELAYSELKVWQDYVAGLKKEVETLRGKLRGPKV
jgi:hypothetical protein